MAGDYLLAIDNGTQSVRALIFKPDGSLVAKKKVKITAYFSPHPGWAEQDPDYFWLKICEACQSVIAENKINPNDIAGIAVTTQRSTLINLDKNGNPLRPAIHWLDQRQANHFKPIGGLWGFIFDISGIRETTNYFQSQAEANWIAENQPEIWAQTDKFIFLSAFILNKLVGRIVDSVASQVGYIPFDYKALAWCKPNDWKWKASPALKKEMLPELVSPGEIIGQITKTASHAIGIPEGTPVVSAAADKACEVLGSGCLSPDIACLSFGTTATINTIHKKYYEVIPLVPPYPAAVPNHYSLEIQIQRGYWMIEWFKQEFAQSEQRLASQRNIPTEELFDELLNAAPPGSMGLMLQPYWSPGVKVPGPEAKGAIIGFGDVHTRAHLYRSIVEGLGYALREGMDRTVKRTHIPIKQMVISGGGSQSSEAVQITADIFGIPTAVPSIYETSALGAAIDIAVGLGFHSNFEKAVKEMTSIGKYIEPNKENNKIYSDLYNRVYLKMYKQLKPLYEEIREITGYPKTF